jgi:formate--tetrahydrofolate ligase
MAMHYSDWAITEAGFGFDLGAEKFFDIKCRLAELDPDAVVLVTTVRALKMHGGKDKKDLETEDLNAVKQGLENLDKHIESVKLFNKYPVVALNRFANDTDEEIVLIRERCIAHGVSFAETTHHADGGKGAIALAKAVMASVEKNQPFTPLYHLDLPVVDKVRAVSRAMYGADDVAFSKQAEKDLKHVEQLGLSHLPICIAKAPSSLSDDPTLHGRPRDFEVTVSSIQINAGAGFLVILTGNIMRMPGLPKHPAANSIKLLENGVIEGLE